MNKIWLDSYPAQIPADISIPVHASLNDLFDKACQQFAEQPAFTSFEHALSYRALHQKATHLAAYFQQHCHLQKGDRIAIMLPNILQFPITFFAALKAGLVVVAINPLYTARELKLQLSNADVKALVILSQMAHKFKAIQAQVPIPHVITTDFTDGLPWLKANMIRLYLSLIKKTPSTTLQHAASFKDALKQGAGLQLTPVNIENGDLALLQYTGGTTGTPRGTMLTHQNMVANVTQTRLWVEGAVNKHAHNTALAPLPLYHIFSLMANNLLLMSMGVENILVADPRNIKSLIKLLKKHPLMFMTGVNTLYNALLMHPDFSKLDFSQQVVSLSGGMSLQKSIAQQWFDITGKPIVEAYGLSECSPAAIINPVDLTAFNGAMGLPIPSTHIKICDEQGQALGIDEVGELYIQGPQVMQGYWHNAIETQKVLTEDGWLKTGDLVKMDAKGFVYFVDRQKDMLVVSGFNVYPTEVEAVVVAHPGVQEAAVVGIPDAVQGEKIKCFVVKADADLSERQLRDYLQQELTGYKRPAIIEFCEAVPKNAVGKVLRRALRETNA